MGLLPGCAAEVVGQPRGKLQSWSGHWRGALCLRGGALCARVKAPPLRAHLVLQAGLHREGLVQEALVKLLLLSRDLRQGQGVLRGRVSGRRRACEGPAGAASAMLPDLRESLAAGAYQLPWLPPPLPPGARTMMTATPCLSYCGRPARPIIWGRGGAGRVEGWAALLRLRVGVTCLIC